MNVNIGYELMETSGLGLEEIDKILAQIYTSSVIFLRQGSSVG
jgi:hypothetical protein